MSNYPKNHMIKWLFVFSLIAMISFRPMTSNIWDTLLKVKYRLYKDSYIPQFDSKIKALDGKKIRVKGYMYPLEKTNKHEFFMLSYYPIEICFFCGGAGPESIIEVSAQKSIYFSKKQINLEGTLRLNRDDPERLFFILLNAKKVK